MRAICIACIVDVLFQFKRYELLLTVSEVKPFCKWIRVDPNIENHAIPFSFGGEMYSNSRWFGFGFFPTKLAYHFEADVFALFELEI